MGATADEVDIRGRWKTRLSGRVVDAYISPEQPWIDARVAEKLCMGAPIAYKLHPDAKRVTPDWLIEHVVPRTHAFYDGVNDISLHLALLFCGLLLTNLGRRGWSLPFVLGSKMPPHQRNRADGYGRWRWHGWWHYGNDRQASTRQVANQSRQVTAMQTQQKVRTNEEILTRIIAQHNQLQQLIAQEGRTRDSSAAALRGWLETWLGAELTKLNGNICRIAVQLQGWQHLIRPAKLAKYRTVGSAWQEWMHGIGGNKPAKNFTADDIRACKSTYSRRKPLWTLMATLVNAQKAPAWVIFKIEEHYKGSVLNITAAIKQDTIMGSLHEDLCIVRAQ
ncbi:hypothetical protein SEMRO_2206_G319030.1 [Seminavis robusta]|uniref:Transcription activator GCR1-like domain-containing protein n=1 Tax=Seminavis robusta TaxID=568900 RepID=A0A9N8HXG3_9STRA|nr:hypothetical protein SEMRO_2206_G319030.1 [Seminavis robusta]|eukprot:Sro2206_g319030.1 n/a (335) ;mRNA; r:13501-14780